MAVIQIERVTTIEQCDACRQVLGQVWGMNDTCSAAQMSVHANYGGVLLLARDGSRPVGALFSFPSRYTGEWVLWSHETAVVQDYLHQGIGEQLKQGQRGIAAELGYQRIVWTFDPLVSRNAHFNLNKLGASVDGYKVDAYGVMPDDLVNRDLPTDRFIAAWPTSDSTPGKAPSFDNANHCYPVLLDVSISNSEPFVQLDNLLDCPDVVLTRIPVNIDDLLERDSRIAMQWRHAFRQVALQLFDLEYRICQFKAFRNHSTYIWSRSGVN